MSGEQDGSTASDQDQDQVDGQLSDEDARGLFGSGSEDEHSGYEATLYYDESKLILLVSARRMLAIDVANLMMPSWIRETMKADSIVFRMTPMDTTRSKRRTIDWQISWIFLLAVILSRNLAMVRYAFIQFWSTKGQDVVLTLAVALSAPVAQFHWHQPRGLHTEELQTSDYRSPLFRVTFVRVFCISNI